MTTEGFIIELFYRVDNELPDVKKHNQAKLYPSEVVTIAFLFAIKGVGNCAFYRWREARFQTSVSVLCLSGQDSFACSNVIVI